jgi:hypothetical protein
MSDAARAGSDRTEIDALELSIGVHAPGAIALGVHTELTETAEDTENRNYN